MPGARQSLSEEPARYATGPDYCRIFEKDMNRLYMLSFLLTADHLLAEKCFVQSLDDSARSNRVWKNWAQSWAVRTIVQNANQMIRPRPGAGRISSRTSDRNAGHAKNEPAEIAAVIGLPAFERFAFVLSVLERYPDQECSLLLNCSRADVTGARAQALQLIGKSAELHRGLASFRSDEQVAASA
jgi:hypothetical protein